MKVVGAWIESRPAQRTCTFLEEAGYHAYFVGGCVRNALLNAPISDIDVATDAPPETVIELAKEAKIRAVATGFDHGTVTLVIDGTPVEVTTFRRDVETDGRRAVVAFSTDIKEDARRRDFTMNALYADAGGNVVDPLGGLTDLRERRVRFIENADLRIKEDYLRILRFFRFYAWYGDQSIGLDAEGLAACAANLAGLETLARERIGLEVLKLLAAPNPAPSVASMEQCGALTTILGGADCRQLPVLVHFEKENNVAPDAIRRLAIMCGEKAGTELRLSKAQSKKLGIFRAEMGAGTSALELGYRHGADIGLSILLLCAALFEKPLLQGASEELRRGAEAVFPVSASDLMPNRKGPDLGKALGMLENAWIESKFTLSKPELLALLV